MQSFNCRITRAGKILDVAQSLFLILVVEETQPYSAAHSGVRAGSCHLVPWHFLLLSAVPKPDFLFNNLKKENSSFLFSIMVKGNAAIRNQILMSILVKSYLLCWGLNYFFYYLSLIAFVVPKRKWVLFTFALRLQVQFGWFVSGATHLVR